MELILKEDIIGLGYKNDIVNVKNGYGRNYLIPTGKAVIASKSAKKVLAENLKQQAGKLAAQKAKVAATGHLYGSVTAATVAEELAKKGIEIDRKIITMRDARKVGDYEAVVHFHKEVEVKVPVKVVAENKPEPVAKKEEKPVEANADEAQADTEESTKLAAEETTETETEAPAAE